MDLRHRPSYASRNAVRVLGAALPQAADGRPSCEGGTQPTSAPERPME